MKYLIRFEDTYGLCDIFCAVRGIHYLELDKCASIQMLDSNTYINFGLGIQSCISFNKSEVAEISRLKIDQILVALDVDDLSGNKHQLLQDYDFEFQFNRTKKKLASAGCGNVKIKFILAAYAAETLELYQYIVPSLFGDGKMERLVHSIDTNELHLIILSSLCGGVFDKDAKKTRNFLDIDKLKRNVAGVDCVNTEIMRWIASGCDIGIGYSENDAKIKLKSLNNRFRQYLSDQRPVLSVGIDGRVRTINLGDRLFDIANELGIKMRK